MHHHPLARLHLRAIDDAVKRGHEAAAHRGRLDEIDARRKIDQVHVRERHRDQVAESSVIREARQQGGEAYVGLPVAAVLASAVALTEWHHDACALLEVAHVLARFLDDAGELMPENRAGLRRESHPRPVARPRVPVGAANAVGLDADDRAGRRAFGIGNSFYDQRLLGSLEYCCFHSCLSPPRRCRLRSGYSAFTAKSANHVLSPGAGVTHAEGSVKPTAGFTSNKVIYPFSPRAGAPRSSRTPPACSRRYPPDADRRPPRPAP